MMSAGSGMDLAWAMGVVMKRYLFFGGGRERTIFALKDIAEPQMDERD